MAHLAGIPRDVVRAARKHLGELEKQLRPQGAHPDLFAPAALPAAAPQDSRLADALDALYRLRRIADEEKG